MSAYLSERVAYLRGLSDGLGIKEESAEDKLILKIIDVLQDISDAVDDVQGDVGDIDFLAKFTERFANAAVCPVAREIPEKIKKELDEYLARKRKEQ